ncbi:hypothetical protein D9611_009615 [Ephemerocybe angulata]|uniref:Uncharacterized protein n=1 Tax=Ephemerocybe angulata TaxID=980116 RepID=A0A8H5C7Z6_9AGAR|nr:hypothetical protein D9611_009615 [Tulosesus angulatus]
MAPETNMSQASGAASGVSLSLQMRDLLGSLIRTIDLRFRILQGADNAENEYHPDTCTVCDGTGFIMVPRYSPTHDDDADDDDDDAVTVPDSEDEDEFPASTKPDGAAAAAAFASLLGVVGASSGASPSSSQLPPATSLLMTPPPTQAPVASSAGAASGATPGAAISAAPTNAIAQASGATPVAAVAAAPANAVAQAGGAPAPVPGPTLGGPSAPAPTVISPPAPAPPLVINVPAVAQAHGVPPMSAIIPGFQALGPNTPPPNPANAVLAAPGEDRYYVVTKGLRVGVLGGWPNTSPYVTGVASASFSRHRSIQGAYDAYLRAWSAGSVAYV